MQLNAQHARPGCIKDVREFIKDKDKRLLWHFITAKILYSQD